MLENILLKAWYRGARWVYLLLPLAGLYRGLVALRRFAYRRGLLSSWRAPVPVLVVGNITVGGTGKTPLTIALVQSLQKAGWKPGVVSRGYGSTADAFPVPVFADTPVSQSGDEPLLIARRCGCPVVIAPDRVAAAKHLLAEYDCDIIVSDDGLQHYALLRDIELLVVDGVRQFGNGLCLPAGPLREPLARISRVDAVVINDGPMPTLDVPAFPMRLVPGELVHINSGDRCAAVDWSKGDTVHAVAGIGNPQRFGQTLEALGFHPRSHWFADHFSYAAEDLAFADGLPVVTTEKDAVKLSGIANQHCWYLEVNAQLDPGLLQMLETRLRVLRQQLL